MEKKNVVLLSVIAVATLLITVVGATFAYYAATISGNPETDTVKITAADNLTITYNGGETITGTNVLPGWESTTYTMTVANDNDFDVTYTMKWNAVSNTLDADDQKNLTFTTTAVTAWSDGEGNGEDLTSAVNPAGTATQFPTTSDGTFAKQSLKPGEKITYTIKVAYKYDEAVQQNTTAESKTFTAKLNIADSDVEVKQHTAA